MSSRTGNRDPGSRSPEPEWPSSGALTSAARHDRPERPVRHDSGEVQSRTRLLDLPVGLVEDLRCGGVRRSDSAEHYSPQFQVCLPYHGLFVWHVGRDTVVGDANQVLFVTGGEGYRISRPLPSGYAELIITPELCVLSEIANATGARLPSHALFRRRSWRASPPLQSFRARFLSWATGASDVDDLEAEELVLSLLRYALQSDGAHGGRGAATTARLIRRTKQFLEAELADPIRLRDVGRAVGASPAYLTHLFRRVEGTSLHQYLTQLRLARALVELPHADDLTTLAIDIGFSSHSHFTAAFRRAFGVTPSEFRQTSRGRLRPSPP
ncbi:MAG: helix-turn-helix domain-containing protein [Luteitalea sp.]|nr:helix-turn-helix domain-containing protein [Luteitalea sp.]